MLGKQSKIKYLIRLVTLISNIFSAYNQAVPAMTVMSYGA